MLKPAFSRQIVSRPAFSRPALSPKLTVFVIISLIAQTLGLAGYAQAAVATDGIHYTITGPTSVTFDWRGTATSISYGLTSSYGTNVTSGGPVVVKENGTQTTITPNSNPGPFQEARLTGLTSGATYHYSISGTPDKTFTTAPAPGASGFTVAAEADIGNPKDFSDMQAIQNQLAGLNPDLVLIPGDFPYVNGTPTSGGIEAFFGDAARGSNNGIEAFSLTKPVMPTWGNHEIDHANDNGTCTGDNLANYKSRFDLPNPKEDPLDFTYCNTGGGEDWYWFDYGNTRFIAQPEPWSDDWSSWNSKVDSIMSAAQSSSNIKFIVTYGHRPAWSSGYHPGESQLATYIKNLHTKYSKFVLQINGHSHNYERSNPGLTDGVTNLTIGVGGGYLENVNSSGCLWQSCPAPSWSAQRFMHYGVEKLTFSSTGITGQYYCGPPGGGTTDITCSSGQVIDTFTIGSAPTDTTPPTTAVTSPSAGSTLSGTVTVSATASDNTGVSRVDLLADGTVVGSDTSSPYTFSWNTASVANGSHSLTTKAYDAAGNAGTSSAVAVTVQQPVSCTYTPDGSLGVSLQTIAAPATGAYKLWARVNVPNTTANSFYVQVDSGCPVNVGDSTAITAGTWSWVDYQDGNSSSKITMNLTAGSHTLKMIGRETGVKADNVLFLSDQTCTPTGTGSNCASTPDTVAPSVPANLAASINSSGQVQLQWTAATDNVAVAGYNILRGGVKIATSASPGYIDTAVTPGATYSYAVSAYDAAGNTSAASTTAVVTVPDAAAPSVSISAPAGGTTVSGTTTVTATAIDNVSVAKVEFYLDGTLAVTDSTSPYTYPLDTTALTNGAHTLVAKAYDPSGNMGTSATVSVTVSNDHTAPTTPTNLSATAVSPAQVNLTWTASTDNVGVAKYIVQRGGVTIAQPTATSYTDATVASGTSYSYRVLAQDAAGNTSPASIAATVTTPQPPDTTPPTTPTNLAVSIVSSTQVNLSWTASTDANGVVGYNILRGGTKIATSTTNSFGDTTAAPGTSYSYTVTAYDAAGNTSPASNAATVTTPSADTTPPTVSISAPANGAAVSGTVDINASASDSVGVSRVDFLVDGAVVSSDFNTPYTYTWNTAGIASGSHALKVTAYDAAGNSSSAQVTVSVGAKPADLNADGSVNIFDLSILLSSWAKTGAGIKGDINQDGVVNVFDLSLLLTAWSN